MQNTKHLAPQLEGLTQNNWRLSSTVSMQAKLLNNECFYQTHQYASSTLSQRVRKVAALVYYTWTKCKFLSGNKIIVHWSFAFTSTSSILV